MPKRKTAGSMSLKAQADNSRYDPLEVAQGMCDDIVSQLFICAKNHEKIFNEEEYFVCLFVAADPLIYGLRRHKYAAFLYLPSPRPEQSCFLYNKKTEKLKRLWSLPNAKVMAAISEPQIVGTAWKDTKRWCDAFFSGNFWHEIRKQYGIKHLSEHEYLNLNREELIKSCPNNVDAPLPESFDFGKVKIDHIIDTKTALGNEDLLNRLGKA